MRRQSSEMSSYLSLHMRSVWKGNLPHDTPAGRLGELASHCAACHTVPQSSVLDARTRAIKATPTRAGDAKLGDPPSQPGYRTNGLHTRRLTHGAILKDET